MAIERRRGDYNEVQANSLFGIADVRGIRAAIGNYSKQGPSSQVSPGPPNVRRSGKGRLGRPFHRNALISISRHYSG